MTFETFLGIFGAIVGVIGLIYTLKDRKKVELSFIKRESIPLFKAIVKNFSEIDITYQGKKISENLILFKGTLINTGNTDIEKSIIHKPVEIELPENCNWIKFKVINKSEGLSINISGNNQKVTV